MFVFAVILKKRKNDNNKTEGTKKRSRRGRKSLVNSVTENLIYMVKATEVSVGVYHYFGRTKDSRTEERLTVRWMRQNHMIDSWRKNNLRGNDGEKLNQWVKVMYDEEK